MIKRPIIASIAFLLLASCASPNNKRPLKVSSGNTASGAHPTKPPLQSAPSPATALFETSNILVEASKITGTIKNTADLNWYFDPDYEIQPNYIRTWCLTGWIPSRKAIFPNLDADPDDPANYTWSELDERLRGYIEKNTRPYILLSIANTEIAKIKQGNKTPRWLIDNRWNIARSLARILYHITSSDPAWDGQGIKIDYVELWNEPCALQYWVNRFKYWPRRKYSRNCFPCFVDIIERTVSDIRKLCGRDIQIGGWAGTSFPDKGLNNRILGEMSKRKVPLDFYSWHDYRTPPQLFDFNLLKSRITNTRIHLKSKGYDIPQHITEWNSSCWNLNADGDCVKNGETIERINPWYKTIKAASQTAEYLIVAQDLPVVVTHRWNGGKEAFGLWNNNGLYRYPVFYSYKLFRNLLKNQRIKAQATDYFVLAGRRENKINILIACDQYNNSKDGYRLFVDDISSSFLYTITGITEKHHRGGTRIIRAGEGESVLDISVPTRDYAVHLVEITLGRSPARSMR